MRIIIFILLSVLITIKSAISAVVTDQDYLVEWNSFNQFNEIPHAQTFTTSLSGRLEGIELVLSRLNPVGNLIIEVQNAINDSPVIDNPVVLASLLIPVNTLPDSSAGGTGPGVVDIDLSFANINVTTGDMLAIVLHKDQGGLTGQDGIVWFGSTNPSISYDGGVGLRLGAVGSGCGDIIIFDDTTSPTENCSPAWIQASTDDYIFKTYVSTVPAPPSIALFLSGIMGMMLASRKKKL